MTDNLPTTIFESILGTLTRMEDRDLPHVYEHALKAGSVLTAPEVMHVRSNADKSTPSWSKAYTSTEVLDGKTSDGNDVVLVLHGTSVLTPDRIRQGYTQGLTKQHAFLLSQEEFDAAYRGETQDGTLKMYGYTEFLKEKPQGRYGIILDRERAAQRTSEDGLTGLCCLSTLPLAIASAGSMQAIEDYASAAGKVFKKKTLGFHHKYTETSSQPQGRLLFLCDCPFVGIKFDYDMESDGYFLTKS